MDTEVFQLPGGSLQIHVAMLFQKRFVEGGVSDDVALVLGQAELVEVGVLIDMTLVDHDLLKADESHLRTGTGFNQRNDLNIWKQTEEMIGHQGERFILFDRVDNTIWTR